MLHNFLHDYVSTLDQPAVEEISLRSGFSAITIHFLFVLFLRVVIALRYSRCEGDLTSFPPRMNTVLGVTCLSSLTLLAPFAYFHILVSKTQFSFLTSLLRDLRRLSSDLTYFNIYKKEDCNLFPTWNNTFILSINITSNFNIIQFHHIFTFTY